MTTKNIIRASDAVSISEREIKLVQMLADDIVIMEIGVKLGLSHRTIESEVVRIRNKVGCKTARGMISLFFRNKLIK